VGGFFCGTQSIFFDFIDLNQLSQKLFHSKNEKQLDIATKALTPIALMKYFTVYRRI